MKKIIVSAVAVAALAFGGVAYAQQQEAPGQNQQGPQQSQQDRDCPRNEGGGQQNEV